MQAGFNQTEFTVSEDVGTVTLCIVVFEPPRNFPVNISVTVLYISRSGTATGILYFVLLLKS